MAQAAQRGERSQLKIDPSARKEKSRWVARPQSASRTPSGSATDRAVPRNAYRSPEGECRSRRVRPALPRDRWSETKKTTLTIPVFSSSVQLGSQASSALNAPSFPSVGARESRPEAACRCRLSCRRTIPAASALCQSSWRPMASATCPQPLGPPAPQAAAGRWWSQPASCDPGTWIRPRRSLRILTQLGSGMAKDMNG